ncbi:hypothetical protein [Brevundimonas sp. UBA5718]|uniref:hypothetical protein n=1 Tax=Brevundimonas sp. UBA5718 TaxID=1946131 RepID=UPI0025BE7CDD|nr:hypothetical protein [Brevundimonas sp. UBA5718]
MSDEFSDHIQRALDVLETDRKGLARMLEVPMTTLRFWEVRSPPAYAWLAIAALAAGLGTRQAAKFASRPERQLSNRSSRNGAANRTPR